MTAPLPTQPIEGSIGPQILITLGQIQTDIAVIKNDLKDLPDHEQRIRALERFRFTLMGAVIVVSAAFSSLGTYIGLGLSRH